MQRIRISNLLSDYFCLILPFIYLFCISKLHEIKKELIFILSHYRTLLDKSLSYSLELSVHRVHAYTGAGLQKTSIILCNLVCFVQFSQA